MALFGLTRSPLQRALNGEWKTEDEKRQVLAAVHGDGGIRAIEILPLLWSADGMIRSTATEVFVARADAKGVATLVEQMQSQHPAARGHATRVLGRIRPDLVTPAIEGLLKDPVATRQRFGWELALELTGPIRVQYAERAVKEAPGPVRAIALQRLLQDRGAPAIRSLLLELSKDAEDKVRELAVEALSKIDGDDVLEAMFDCFVHGNATVRAYATEHIKRAAARAPADLRPRLMKLLSEGGDSIRRQSVELLLATGTPEEVILEILVYCRSLLGWLRSRILNTLMTFGDDVLRPAVKLLGHADDDVRMQALVLVEHFNDPRVVGAVVRLLDDPDWWLRITACETLSKLKNESVVPHLIKALEDPDTRWAALDALGNVGGEQALRALVGLLRDPRPEVRTEALQALGRTKDPRLAKVFQQVMEGDGSQEVRTRAAELLRVSSGGASGVEVSTSAVKSSQIDRPLDKVLAFAREHGASDIHITVGEPPFFRINGTIKRIKASPLDENQTRAMILDILDPVRRAAFEKAGEIDFCHSVPGVGRYRANAFVQRKGTCASFRCIPNIPPTFADLRLPGHLTELLDYHQGIILVTGPAGGGKSTTLAAIINLINETKASHVITLEDPIEFVHPAKSALVNQREIGRHTESFARALRAALREDPDVIMVGEMRDVETIRMALSAAETGHLVIATMHTTSAVATVDRLIESFPPDEQQQVRMALSESLKYVVSQSLVPRADRKGRVAVFEVLKGTHAVGGLIREEKTYQLPSVMQTSRALGMQTLDQALEELLISGLITAETAYLRAEKKENFEGRLGTAAPSANGGAS